MLILTRKPGESLYIGDDVKVTIVELKGRQIRVGIEAPKSYRIYREEIYLAILEENRKAAGAIGDDQMAGLDNISKVLGNSSAKEASTVDSASAEAAEKPTVKMPSAFGSLQARQRGAFGGEVFFKKKRGKKDE